MRIYISFQTSVNPKPKPISNEIKPIKSLTYQIASCLKLRSNFICFFFSLSLLRIFQRFRLVKFIEKFKTRVKILKIEEIIAFDKYSHELFFAFYFHLSKKLFLTLKNNKFVDLTHFSSKCGCFQSF